MALPSHAIEVPLRATDRAAGPVGALSRSTRTRRAGEEVDDFPRLATGFIVGLAIALLIIVANTVLIQVIFNQVRPTAGAFLEWCLVPMMLSQSFLLGAIPITCAALLARGDRMKAGQRTLTYCYSTAVLFALVCVRPLEPSAALVLALVGAGGLAGVCCLALFEGYRIRAVGLVPG